MTTHRTSLPAAAGRREHGAVLLFTLIALTILLISAVAMVRSFNSAMFNAGNVAFKRDLLNQGERVVPRVIAELTTGDLAAEAARNAHLPAKNYSATVLPSNARGIPTALLDDTAFATVWLLPDITVDGQAVTIRYLVDRLCRNTGDASAQGCTQAEVAGKQGGPASELGGPPPPVFPVYRLSIRVSGPRNTQAFFQTTLNL